MKKRLFTILAVLVMVVCLTSVTAFADNYFCSTCGGTPSQVNFRSTRDGHFAFCGGCGNPLGGKEAHVVSSWSYNNDATCTGNGTKSGRCVKCSANVTDNDPEHQATGQHTWENGKCKVCDYECTHSGGTATCTAAAVCETCGQSYGDTDQSNHSGTAEWTKTATTHEKKWSCCNAVVVASEAHEWENGVCSECDYVCTHSGGEATCAAAAVCEVCGQSYGNRDQKNHSNLQRVAAKAATSSAAGNIEYWYCDGCGKYFSGENAATEITQADTVTPKLPAITEGGAQTVTVGEKKALTFTSDAAFADFIRVEIDGVTLDGKNYTVKEGSTIVTLNADYVAALAAGEHTLNIVSEGGTATAKFTVTEKAAETTEKPDKADKPVVNDKAKAPKTGDSGNAVLWLALLLVSGGAVTAATLVSRKKKYNR